ncbi:MAG TPA: glycosyltransferase family 39 protein [Opitutaceae bacterium]|jgi:hypothetical protein
MPTVSENPQPALFTGRDRLFLGTVSAVGFILGLVGIYHYGYNAQDFITHKTEILTFPDTVTYKINYSLGLAWFGHLLESHVTATHFLEAIAFAFLVFNTAALWIVYAFVWQALRRRPLRYAAAAFVTFVPFRVTTALVLASDGFTLPLFAIVALCVLRLCARPNRAWTWLLLGLALLAGTLCKYSLAGLVPPAAILVFLAILRRLPPKGRLVWVAAAIMALAPPAILVEFEMRQVLQNNGSVEGAIWNPKFAPPPMRWRDLLLFQASDSKLFAAPDYFRGELFWPRAYSYPALLHVACFSDLLGNFQTPRVTTDWKHRSQVYVYRWRSPLSQVLQEISVASGLIFSALAVVGLAVCGVMSVLALATDKPRIPLAVTVLTLLALGYYVPQFYSLHYLARPYSLGYWLPRLIIPSLVVFFILGFVLLDLAAGRLERSRRNSGPLLIGFAGYTLACCAIYCGFLF